MAIGGHSLDENCQLLAATLTLAAGAPDIVSCCPRRFGLCDQHYLKRMLSSILAWDHPVGVRRSLLVFEGLFALHFMC